MPSAVGASDTVFVVVLGRVSLSLSSHGCSGTHYVDQTGLKPVEIHLLLLPECWD